jgi:hypothetical protein
MFIFPFSIIISCGPYSENRAASLDSLATDSVTMSDAKNVSLYAQLDSVLTIDGKVFTVQVKQFDLTDVATRKGDTLNRPTYVCKVRIMDAARKIVFADSVLRDSWAYPGKIVSIDAYEIALPTLQNKDSEIILAFNIFEQYDGDAITGFIAFDIYTREFRYYWEESIPG